MKRHSTSSSTETLISEDDIAEIYSNIPYFSRRWLKQEIDKMQWLNALVASENGQPELAERVYRQVLHEMDKFILLRRRSGSELDIHYAHLMVLDKRNVTKMYERQPAAFVKDMLDCMDKENKLDPIMELEMDSKEEVTSESPGHAPMEEESIENDLAKIEALIGLAREKLIRFNEIIAAVQENQMQISGEDEHSGQFQRTVLESLYEEHQQYFQESIRTIEEISSGCKNFIDSLIKEVDRWRKAQALSCTNLGPENSFDCASYKRFIRFASALSTCLAWFGQYHRHDEEGLGNILKQHELTKSGQNMQPSEINVAISDLIAVEKKYLENIVIVTLQPKDIVGVENKSSEQTLKQDKKKKNKSRKDSGAQEEEKTSEEKANKFTSKKYQAFNTQISIPGGEKFPGLSFTYSKIECVEESNLAKAASRGEPISSAPCSKESTLNWDNMAIQTIHNCDLQFNKIMVSYQRPRTSNVYKEFFRLRYCVTIVVFNREYNIQVLSLPFHFNTGSIQLLDLVGARMWYIFSSPSMYSGSFEIMEELMVKEVKEMLDLRVRHIAENARPLRQEELDFLASRLPVQENNGKVSLNGFLKNELINTNAQPPHPSCPFNIWFHSIVNTIKTMFLEAWNRGAIYGLISKEHSQRLLTSDPHERGQKSHQANQLGTFLLRFSNYLVEKTSSVRPLVAVNMDVIMKYVDPSIGKTVVKVKTAPLLPTTLDTYGLYGSVIGIELNKQQLARVLLTSKNSLVKVDFLKEFNAKSSDHVFEGYSVKLERVAKMNMHILSPTDTKPQPPARTGKGASKSGSKPKKASGKKSPRKSPHSSDNQPSVSPPLPHFAEPVSPDSTERFDLAVQTLLAQGGGGQSPDGHSETMSSLQDPIENQTDESSDNSSNQIVFSNTKVKVDISQLSSPTGLDSTAQRFDIMSTRQVGLSSGANEALLHDVTHTGSSCHQMFGVSQQRVTRSSLRAASQAAAFQNMPQGISSQMLQQRSPEGMTQTMSPRNMAQQMSPHGMTQTMSPQCMAQQMSPHGMAQTMSSQNMTQQMSPHGMTQSMSPQNMAQQMSSHGMAQTMSPQNMAEQMSPDGMTQTMSPQSMAQQMSPHGMTQTMSPQNMTRQMSPQGMTLSMSPQGNHQTVPLTQITHQMMSQSVPSQNVLQTMPFQSLPCTISPPMTQPMPAICFSSNQSSLDSELTAMPPNAIFVTNSSSMDSEVEAEVTISMQGGQYSTKSWSGLGVFVPPKCRSTQDVSPDQTLNIPTVVQDLVPYECAARQNVAHGNLKKQLQSLACQTQRQQLGQRVVHGPENEDLKDIQELLTATQSANGVNACMQGDFDTRALQEQIAKIEADDSVHLEAVQNDARFLADLMALGDGVIYVEDQQMANQSDSGFDDNGP